jgi:hypothetical protein
MNWRRERLPNYAKKDIYISMLYFHNTTFPRYIPVEAALTRDAMIQGETRHAQDAC